MKYTGIATLFLALVGSPANLDAQVVYQTRPTTVPQPWVQQRPVYNGPVYGARPTMTPRDFGRTQYVPQQWNYSTRYPVQQTYTQRPAIRPRVYYRQTPSRSTINSQRTVIVPNGAVQHSNVVPQTQITPLGTINSQPIAPLETVPSRSRSTAATRNTEYTSPMPVILPAPVESPAPPLEISIEPAVADNVDSDDSVDTADTDGDFEIIPMDSEPIDDTWYLDDSTRPTQEQDGEAHTYEALDQPTADQQADDYESEYTWDEETYQSDEEGVDSTEIPVGQSLDQIEQYESTFDVDEFDAQMEPDMPGEPQTRTDSVQRFQSETDDSGSKNQWGYTVPQYNETTDGFQSHQQEVDGTFEESQTVQEFEAREYEAQQTESMEATTAPLVPATPATPADIEWSYGESNESTQTPAAVEFTEQNSAALTTAIPTAKTGSATTVARQVIRRRAGGGWWWPALMAIPLLCWLLWRFVTGRSRTNDVATVAPKQIVTPQTMKTVPAAKATTEVQSQTAFAHTAKAATTTKVQTTTPKPVTAPQVAAPQVKVERSAEAFAVDMQTQTPAAEIQKVVKTNTTKITTAAAGATEFKTAPQKAPAAEFPQKRPSTDVPKTEVQTTQQDVKFKASTVTTAAAGIASVTAAAAATQMANNAEVTKATPASTDFGNNNVIQQTEFTGQAGQEKVQKTRPTPQPEQPQTVVRSSKPVVVRPVVSEKQPEQNNATHKIETPATTAVAAVKDGERTDDFTQLPGVDASMRDELYRCGYRSYTDLVSADPKKLESQMQAAGHEFGTQDFAKWVHFAAVRHESKSQTAAAKSQSGKPAADGRKVEVSSSKLTPVVTGASVTSQSAQKADDQKADDLTVINGIGPATQEVLHKAGIRTFGQLQAASTNRLQTILKQAGSRFALIDPTTWSLQSGYAVAGRWDELKQWMESQTSETQASESQTRSTAPDTIPMSRNVATDAPSRNSKADDLTVINGIGPATQTLLHKAGIHTFAQLESADTSRLQGILTQAGSRFALIDPTTWSHQAGFAVAGQWDQLKQWIATQASESTPAITMGAVQQTQQTQQTQQSEADDLTQIKGIGPATQKILNSHGIVRFEQVSVMNETQFEKILNDAADNMSLVDAESWSKQAMEILGSRFNLKGEAAILEYIARHHETTDQTVAEAIAGSIGQTQS